MRREGHSREAAFDVADRLEEDPELVLARDVVPPGIVDSDARRDGSEMAAINRADAAAEATVLVVRSRGEPASGRCGSGIDGEAMRSRGKRIRLRCRVLHSVSLSQA
jgi:hypothetical protein